ncbi:MAG: glycogen/starch/alpha-glucan phosphorylase [Betaproteobacteria bacterium]|nr:MAG: glycogen/starch/alpha-glucan phosphorylase [Betaproteobacteria bacterium]
MTRLANPLSKLFKSTVNAQNTLNVPNEFASLVARTLSQRSDSDSPEAKLQAVSEACRTLLADRWARTQQADAKRQGARRVHYLSMEFLMGRALTNALAALELNDTISPDFGALVEREPDAALGNGGLGRLAACFLDSFATLGLPSFGYGLRYEHGMFAQRIQGGRQTEVPDTWLKNGNPWELFRPELQYEVGFGGAVSGHPQSRHWVPSERLVARAYDFIVPGHNTERVSTLRQWQASAADPIDYLAFSRGEHASAGQHVQRAASLNWVLYPDDSTAAGRELRLKQEFFLVSASLQDMIARHLREGRSIEYLGKHNAVHLNDTHPALSVAELMRLLLDEHGLAWQAAWRITREATSYTNHTLMPEALETWPVRMLEALLPRHLEVIYSINQFVLDEVRAKFPDDDARVQRMSLIDEVGERRVRMANLAIVASSRVNGVSALHSELMVQTIFSDFAAMWPERFINVTNGVTARRWLAQANPKLSALIDRNIGAAWRGDLTKLRALSANAKDAQLGADFMAVKLENKQRLADHIRRELGIAVNVNSVFDVQIKRIHEYKRQLLNVLHVIARYQAIIANPNAAWTPRTVIFSGKAASAYVMAKQIIQLIHDVGRVVNSDSRVGDKLKVVFLPNYSVSLAEVILPAADLSEQISTAGTEASGTGNMKFALNGALTVGTWDGANIEMAEQMGIENMFVFGLRTDAVAQMKSVGYDPKLYIEENAQLKGVIDAIAEGVFSWDEPDRYRSIVQSLTQRDPYLLMADFADYLRAQNEVDALYQQPKAWAERAIRNVAGMGFFSVDRTIGEYIEKVWRAPG